MEGLLRLDKNEPMNTDIEQRALFSIRHVIEASDQAKRSVHSIPFYTIIQRLEALDNCGFALLNHFFLHFFSWLLRAFGDTVANADLC